MWAPVGLWASPGPVCPWVRFPAFRLLSLLHISWGAALLGCGEQEGGRSQAFSQLPASVALAPAGQSLWFWLVSGACRPVDNSLLLSLPNLEAALATTQLIAGLTSRPSSPHGTRSGAFQLDSGQ